MILKTIKQYNLLISSYCLPSGTPVFTPFLSRVRVAQSLVFCLVFCKSLFVYLNVLFPLAIVLSVLLRITASDYPFWYL
jgi:hypothetical protein